jgi:hypothetical protein
MRTKSLSLAIALSTILTTNVLAAPRTQQPKTQDPQQDVTVVERVIRAVKKIVHTFDQPAVPIPGTSSTTT